MTVLRITLAMGVLIAATGCCSTSERWGYMEGYENIKNSVTAAPRYGEYSLWRLSGIKYMGLCACRDEPDRLISTITLRTGERLGIRKRGERMEAYAGAQTIALFDRNYAWRRKITEEELKRKAQDEYSAKKNRDCILWGVLLTLAFCIDMLAGVSFN